MSPPPPYVCPDCGLRSAAPPESSPFVCPSCLQAAAPRPPEGWPIEDRWVGPGRGRGVFALRALKSGEVVERCWVMPLTPEESQASGQMEVLRRYLFPWKGGVRAMVSGAGLLYNFDRADVTGRSPNVLCVLRHGISAIEFRTLRDVNRGEELSWDYQKATALAR